MKDGRLRRGWTQLQAATVAGISRSEWSGLELGRRDATFWILNRAAHAVGGRLKGYIEHTSAADAPRDAVHLKGQELILRTAAQGGWRGLPEAALDRDVSRSRFADVLLARRRAGGPREVALIELIDWFDDVGTPTRAWQRRLEAVERQEIVRLVGSDSVPRVSGCWIVRATKRNRALIAEHRHYFRARFAGSGRAWLHALTRADTRMPDEPALVWISVSSERLFAARFAVAD